MATVAGRFKETDLIIKGEVEERLPRITDGLVSHFPFDGSIQDRLTEFYVENVTTTTRDWYGDYFPSQYDYSNMTLIITGSVFCEEAVNYALTTAIGFAFKIDDTANPGMLKDTWFHVKDFTLSDIQDRWVNFTLKFTVPSTYRTALKPWIQINIPGGTTGYKVMYDNVNIFLVEDAKYIKNVNTDLTQEYLSIRESSQNYLANGNFSDGLTNWVQSASATTLSYIYTPYGPGVRVQRDDGDIGNWSLAYTGPRDWTYKAGETWVWSFKVKSNRGSVRGSTTIFPFYVGWWINDNGAYRNNLVVNTIPLNEDGWYQCYASYTFTADYPSLTTCGFNSFSDFSNVDFTDIRLEKRNFPTNTPDNSISDDPEFGLNVTLPDTFSLSDEKKFVTETEWTRYGITKDADNTFVFYKNGVPTTEFVNLWQMIKVKGVGKGRNVGYEIANYTDPVEKIYEPARMSCYMTLNTDDCGYYFRTYLYCSADVSVVQHFYADNYSGMRVNNGDLIWSGGWENGTTTINPDITVDLVKGWNMVEMVWMDGDSGGAFRLNTGYLSFPEVPEVLYMTAELPIEMSNNQPFFNEKSNVDIRNMSIYNRTLTENEMRSLHGTKGISIDKNGNLKMVIKETIPYLPSDAYYFPLGVNGSDINNAIKPVTESNIVYEDGWAWVGRKVINLIQNGDGSSVPTATSTPGSVKPGWDTAMHPYAIGVDNWSNGYNGGVTSPEIGYHAQWVYEGFNGDTDPCMKFINRNDIYGQPNRWLGFSQSLPSTPTTYGWVVGTQLILQWKQRATVSGDAISAGLYYYTTSGSTSFASGRPYKPIYNANTWETVTHSITLPADIDLSKNCKIYVYGHDGITGILWSDDFMLARKPFNVPFTPSIRDDSSLNYNFYDSLGLQWNQDWSIVYFKKPMGTYTDNFTGYNIESLGCNTNTVGGSYMYWGKANGTDTIYASSPSVAFDTTKYFNNARMVSLVCKSGVVTIKEWDYYGNVWTRTSTIGTGIPANAFVNQYGYDFRLGGWDNTNAVNSYYRDLIVAKRAFTDDEITNLFKTRASSREDAFYISGKIVVNPTLS